MTTLGELQQQFTDVSAAISRLATGREAFEAEVEGMRQRLAASGALPAQGDLDFWSTQVTTILARVGEAAQSQPDTRGQQGVHPRP